MTAELSESETESRHVATSSEARLKVGLDRERLTDRHALTGDHSKHSARIIRELEVLKGARNDGSSGRGPADLTAGFEDRLSGGFVCAEVDHGAALQPRKKESAKQLSFWSFRKVEGLSSEGDIGDETEDDFEEGDGAIAEVASHRPQQVPQHSESLKQSLRRKELQQPLPPVHASEVSAGWESFLPQRSIRVLLAEDDDSTRQVVGALLRNCSYEVSSVANGMQAWELLEDSSNHFDLVLTDVVMPCLSGVGLLTKIMSKESGKRTPVIMMSSHDSLDIVFRCLSKGAADFLVKPVRKNELKNLWQHVWRCQSASGSGSGCGNGKAVRTSQVGSGNNTGCCDGSEDSNSGLNVWGGSDNGSGTQAAINNGVHKLKRDKVDEKGQATSLEKLSNHRMGQDLEMATQPVDAPGIHETHHPELFHDAKSLEERLPSLSDNSGNKLEKESGSGFTNSGGSSANAANLLGGVTFQVRENGDEGVQSGHMVKCLDRALSSCPANDKFGSYQKPLLELSLNRSRSGGEEGNDEKCILRHSGGSAFSRYSTNGTTIQQLPAVSPFSLAKRASEITLGIYKTASAILAKAVPFSNVVDKVGTTSCAGEIPSLLLVKSQTALKEWRQDVGCSMVGSCTLEDNSHHLRDESGSASPSSRHDPSIPLHLPPQSQIYDGVAAYGPGIGHVFYTNSPAPRWVSRGNYLSDRGELFDHPPHHEYGLHLPYQSSDYHSPGLQPFLHTQQDDQALINQGTVVARCDSSSIAGPILDVNTLQSGSCIGYGSYCHANGSAFGSNNHNVPNFVVKKMIVQNGSCGGNYSCSGVVECNGSVAGEVQVRFARREAALNKFRQKRKERCFEKKVRYQSRKRLAEQRPRVKGQFVRQATHNSNAASERFD